MSSKHDTTTAIDSAHHEKSGERIADEASTSTEPEKRAPISNYWRVLSFGSRQDHVLLLVGMLCAAGSGVALPLMNIVFGNLVGSFNDYFIPGSTTTKAQFLHAASQNALRIVYLFIGKFFLTYVGAFCFRCGGLRISAGLRLSYMQALFAQPIRKLDEVSAGAVSNTITSSANNIQLSISEKLAVLFQSLALLVAAYAIAFSYSWQLTLVTSSALLFVIIVYSFTTPVAIKLHQKVDKADEKHASIAGEIFSSIRTVLSMGAEKPLSHKYFSWVDESRSRGLEFAPLMGVQLAPIFFAMYASFALSFWFGLKLFRDGHIRNINAVVIVIFSIIIVVAVLGGIVVPLVLVTKAISASASFFSMIDSPRVNQDGRGGTEVSAKHDIEFDSVAFAYPTRSNVKVLKDFNATFKQGKTTALVGPSGSGKSTIVALLERWYELTEADKDVRMLDEDSDSASGALQNQGVVRVGEDSITTFDLKWWRTQIGLVSQEPFLFNDTILNNVAFGLLGTEWENACAAEKFGLVREACEEAFADEFIDRLPQGYNTMVGESGIKLSGGQRQRLAIARSIVRRPTILILDEATSSIDIRSEKIVQKALERVSQARTTIVIAHRLSTIQKADHIIVLREGTKIEEGTHEYLISLKDGLYSGLVRAQQIENESAPGQVDEEELKPILSAEKPGSSIKLAADEESQPQSKYKKRGFFSSVGLFLYEQRQHWWLYLLTVVGAMGGGTSFSLQAFFFSKLIEVFRFTGQKLTSAGNHWSLMFFILALAMAASYFIMAYASTAVSHHVAAAYRKDYFGNILRRPILYFDAEDNSSGSLMSRLSSDPRLLYEILGPNGAFPLVSIFNLTGCIIISFYFGWKLSLVAIFAIMPVLLVSSFIRLRHEHTFEKMNNEVFASSSQFATEAIGAFRTVSSLTMEDTIIAKYSALLSDQIRRSTRKASYAMLVYAFTDSVELAAMALAFWYGSRLLGSHEYNPVQFFVIYIAVVQGSQGAGQFFSFVPNIAQATAGANRILSLRETGNINESTSEPLPASDKNLGAAVEFSNVSFRYPSRSIPTFLNLSLTIPAGGYVAFVGPSGVGKSTIISLLERFYAPVLGTITYDGVDVSKIDVTSYRSAISLVAQEPKLFEGSIKENLLLGVHGKDVSQEDMHQACSDAEIHDFIVSLPEGYDTQLGLNSSTALSGGQKQRLCLARALLRKPKLLLLDEATSSLDSQSEKLVQTAIERLAAGRNMTVVAVAHRLATIQKADCIFVFGEGEGERGARLVEKGSHRELIGRRGVYWQMCRGQALDR